MNENGIKGSQEKYLNQLVSKKIPITFEIPEKLACCGHHKTFFYINVVH